MYESGSFGLFEGKVAEQVLHAGLWSAGRSGSMLETMALT
jgi:hypothetical protein